LVPRRVAIIDKMGRSHPGLTAPELTGMAMGALALRHPFRLFFKIHSFFIAEELLVNFTRREIMCIMALCPGPLRLLAS
ncbi:MAG: hypothetical protein ACE5GO_09865, partial [Anaerolineales bacterium]